MEEQMVHLVEFPKDPLNVGLNLKTDGPCPVSIIFADQAANVNMNMIVVTKEPIPVCIKICDPICVEHNYRIGINLMGQPFAEITATGLTRILSCNDDKRGNPPTVIG